MKIHSIPTTIFFIVTGFTFAAVAAVDDGQLSCLLEPSQEIRIASQVQGVVKQVHGERGDRVKKGEVLISLEQGLEVAAVELASAKVEFSKRKVERNQELIDSGLLTAHEADEILTEHNLFELELKQAQESLKQKIIYSPVDGVIVERMVARGEYAGMEPLMKLAVLDPLHAEIVMNAGAYGQVKKAGKVEILPEGRQEEKYTGIVKIVDQIIDAASATFGVQVEIANPGFSLPAGLKCSAHFLDE